MVKHFGVNSQMGYVSADEILQIGNIIRNGRLEIISENERHYVVDDPNFKGRKLTVVVKKSAKKGQPDCVITFYSNKKAEEVRAHKRALGAAPSDLSSSTMPTASQNSSESQEKILEKSKKNSEAENAPESEKGFNAAYAAKEAPESAQKAAPSGAQEIDIDGEYKALSDLRARAVAENPSTFIRAVSAMRSALPKSVKYDNFSLCFESFSGFVFFRKRARLSRARLRD